MISTQAWIKSKNIIALIIGIVIFYFSVTTLVNNRFHDLESYTRLQIENQKELLSTISKTTARNGADDITESIIKDCSNDERSQFDDLLGRLNKNLSQAQLIELERLFSRCGDFSAGRKSIMASRLSKEIEIYKVYVDYLSIVTGEDKSVEFNLQDWQDLASEESKQSELFVRLVSLQAKIISTLLAGSNPESSEITTILTEVGEVQKMQLAINDKTSTLRAKLVSN